ncbi:helix-turn-helix domain-containing protein [Avibacterium gallinarum]|uniref:helix-turn-helix domain-containing protein n=1 Tax=Avibacterium gallinarum TaxID=755 RepID=UPI003BF8CEC4
MAIHEKIRLIREMNHWSQEEMAEKMNLSPSGYAKIERGETQLHYEKLKKIAQIFDMDISELVKDDRNICFLINENSHLSSNYYATNEAVTIENEKLKLALSYKDQLLEQKDKEIESLKEIIALLKVQHSKEK